VSVQKRSKDWAHKVPGSGVDERPRGARGFYATTPRDCVEARDLVSVMKCLFKRTAMVQRRDA